MAIRGDLHQQYDLLIQAFFKLRIIKHKKRPEYQGAFSKLYFFYCLFNYDSLYDFVWSIRNRNQINSRLGFV